MEQSEPQTAIPSNNQVLKFIQGIAKKTDQSIYDRIIDQHRHEGCDDDLKEAQGGSCHEIEFDIRDEPLQLMEDKYNSQYNHEKLSMLLKKAKMENIKNPLNRTYEFPKNDPRFVEHQLRNGNIEISE